jgi:hypothetical protein
MALGKQTVRALSAGDLVSVKGGRPPASFDGCFTPNCP